MRSSNVPACHTFEELTMTRGRRFPGQEFYRVTDENLGAIPETHYWDVEWVGPMPLTKPGYSTLGMTRLEPRLNSLQNAVQLAQQYEHDEFPKWFGENHVVVVGYNDWQFIQGKLYLTWGVIKHSGERNGRRRRGIY